MDLNKLKISSRVNTTTATGVSTEYTGFGSSAVLTNKNACNTAGEEQISVEDALSKELVVSTFTWTNSGLTYTPLQIPTDLLTLNNDGLLYQMGYSYFRFFRSGYRIQITLTGSKFSQGRLLAYYVPKSAEDDQVNVECKVGSCVSKYLRSITLPVSNCRFCDV